MNYYAARQKESDKLWHYTCMNDGSVWAVGNCSPWETCPDCKDTHQCGIRYNPPHCAKCGDSGMVKKSNPCPGHATQEEAEEHYREYLLERIEFRGPKTETWPKEKCAVDGCENEAKYLGFIPGDMGGHNKELCEQHANKETFAQFVERPGQIWSS